MKDPGLRFELTANSHKREEAIRAKMTYGTIMEILVKRNTIACTILHFLLNM